MAIPETKAVILYELNCDICSCFDACLANCAVAAYNRMVFTPPVLSRYSARRNTLIMRYVVIMFNKILNPDFIAY